MTCAGLLRMRELVSTTPMYTTYPPPLPHTPEPELSALAVVANETQIKAVSKAVSKAIIAAAARAMDNLDMHPTSRRAVLEHEPPGFEAADYNADVDALDRGALNVYIVLRCSFGDLIRACVIDAYDVKHDADM